MKEIQTAATMNRQAAELAAQDRTLFGFWVYLMTDCILFASLFAVFAVLRHSTYGGPAEDTLVDLPSVLIETMLLLTSSFSCGLAVLAGQAQQRRLVLAWLAVTFILGAGFLGLELSEFRHLAVEGNSWHRSGSLSAFFTLVGTHGLHITAGLLWMVVLSVQLVRKGLTASSIKRLALFSLFWHFLDVIWIFIFSIVYMFGAL